MKENKIENLPKHIALIVDGNRRWAVNRDLPYIEGHKEAVKRLEDIIDYSIEAGVEQLTFWLWSTKNWKRSRDFINDIFDLMRSRLVQEEFYQNAIKKGVKFHHLGVWDGFPNDIVNSTKKKLLQDPAEKKIDVNIAIGYEGRDEITRAVKKIVEEGIPPEKIDQKLISEYLYTVGQPEVDLLIRTGGEKRTSGYLIWQAADAEFYFTDTYMPDFTVEEFKKALIDYSKRERRMGGDSKKY